MSRQLVFVHGRSQQGKNAAALKAQWVEALCQGLAKSSLKLPIAASDIRFPYYGDTLDQLVRGRPAAEAAKVIVRGEAAGEEEQNFVRAMILEIQQQLGITDQQVMAVSGASVSVRERGIQNWEWVHQVLQAIDRYVPGASSNVIAVATRDVYLYLNNPGFQDVIDTGVRAAFSETQEAVVVAHSLGTVVAYNVLRSHAAANGHVPLLVTLGSPLGIQAVKDALYPLVHPACVSQWFNALDERDVVALYPLDAQHFPVTPLVENKTDVENTTANRHGISGYVSDKVVAQRIYAALTA